MMISVISRRRRSVLDEFLNFEHEARSVRRTDNVEIVMEKSESAVLHEWGTRGEISPRRSRFFHNFRFKTNNPRNEKYPILDSKIARLPSILRDLIYSYIYIYFLYTRCFVDLSRGEGMKRKILISQCLYENIPRSIREGNEVLLYPGDNSVLERTDSKDGIGNTRIDERFLFSPREEKRKGDGEGGLSPPPPLPSRDQQVWIP